jgi:hypothetical protein
MIWIFRFGAMIAESGANDLDRPKIICDHPFSGISLVKVPEMQMIFDRRSSPLHFAFFWGGSGSELFF